MGKNANKRWHKPTQRERLDRYLERKGLLNYQTEGMSAADIAQRYEDAHVNVRDDWFEQNYGVAKPSFNPSIPTVPNNSQVQTQRPNLTGGYNNPATTVPDNKIIKTDVVETPKIPTVYGPNIRDTRSVGFVEPKMNLTGDATLEDVKSGKANWSDVDVNTRKTILSDPRFYKENKIVDYSPAVQQEILKDTNFNWDNLPDWQKPYYQASSNPAKAGASQGATFGLISGGPVGAAVGGIVGGGFGWLAGKAEYDPTKEFWKQKDDDKLTFDLDQAADAARFVFGFLNWGSEQIEKVVGLGVQSAASMSNPDKYGKLGDVFTKEGWNAGAMTYETIGPQVAGGWIELKNGLQSGDPIQYFSERFKNDDATMLETMLLGITAISKPHDFILGANDLVPISDKSMFEEVKAARDRIKNGENYRDVAMDFQRGVLAQTVDLIGQAVLDPLNVAPNLSSALRAKGLDVNNKVIKAFASADGLTPEQTARIKINEIKAEVYRSTPSITGDLFSNSPVSRKFREIIKSTPNVEQYLNTWERKIAGLDVTGKITELSPVNKSNIPQVVRTFFSLTPEARAKKFQQSIANVFSMMIDWSKNADEIQPKQLVDIFEAAGNADNQTLSKFGADFMGSPEAYTVTNATKGFIPEMRKMVENYDLIGANREMLRKIQETLGDKPRRIINDFTGNNIKQTFERLQAKLATINTPDAKQFLQDINDGNITSKVISDMLNVFSDAPINNQEFMISALNKFDDHMRTWGKDYFQLKPETTIESTLRLLKGVQSLALLDMSPSAIVNDFVNERVMMADSGVLGLTSRKAIDKFFEDFGMKTKETGYDISGETSRKGGVVDELTRGKGKIADTATAVNKARQYSPRSALSRKFNAAHADQIGYIKTKEFFSQVWKEGKGFDKMSPELEAAFRAKGINPEHIYQNLRSSYRLDNISNLQSKAITHSVGSYIDHVAGALGKSTEEVTSALAKYGILDTLTEKLELAKTPVQRQLVFDSIVEAARNNAIERDAQHLTGMLDHYKNKIGTEKLAGALQASQDIALDFFEGRMENDSIWDIAWKRVEKITDKKVRNAILGKAAQDASAMWQSRQLRQEALYKAMFDSMEMGSGFYFEFIKQFREEHNTMREYFKDKNEAVQNLINSTADYKLRNELWEQHNKLFNERFDKDHTRVIESSKRRNDLFVVEQERLFGAEGGALARKWTDAVMVHTEEIHGDIVAFREYISNVDNLPLDAELFEWKSQEWKRFKKEVYQVKWRERMATDMDGAANLYKLDEVNPDDVNNYVTEKAAKETRLQEIYSLAEPFGFSDRKRFGLLYALQKYGDSDIKSLDDPRITTEYINRVLEDRVNTKGSARANLEVELVGKAIDLLSEEIPFTDPSFQVRQDMIVQGMLKDIDADIAKNWETEFGKAVKAQDLNRIMELADDTPNGKRTNGEDFADYAYRMWSEIDRTVQKKLADEAGQTLRDFEKKNYPDGVKGLEEQLNKEGIAGDMPIYPPGGYDQTTGWGDIASVIRDGFNEEIRPVVELMRTFDETNKKSFVFEGAKLDPQYQAQFDSYLKKTGSQLTTTKRAAKGVGEAAIDYALLDYERQYGFDKLFSAGVPYEFFGTRSGANWLVRVMDRPAWISQYARLQKQHNRYENNLPERMRNKYFIPVPFLPEWMGGGVFIDPTYQLFPFKQYIQPLQAMMRDQEQINNSATYVLRDWAEDGSITLEDAQNALATKEGADWERAVAEARFRQGDNLNTSADYFSMLFGPALYLTVPYYLATGKKPLSNSWPSSPLPITRTGMALETIFKDTQLESVGNILGGLMAAPERYVRKELKLNEFGEWGDFYIDRQLANMAAEGMDSKLVYQAMIEREGNSIYEQARERVKQELALKVPGMLTLYGATHGASLDQIVGSSITTLFPGGILSPAEMEQKGLKQEYTKAWDEYAKGDKKAITEFFDKYPEYTVRLALRKDPQARLNNFLKSSIWDEYNKLGTTDRKTLRAFLGDDFDLFLSSDPDVEWSNEQLAMWAKVVNASVPKVQETQTIIEKEEQGQIPRPDYYSPEVTQIADQFFAQRTNDYPNYYEQQQEYYALPKSKRASYLLQNPKLQEYFDWKKKWEKAYPSLKDVFNGKVFKNVDTSTWPPMLEDYVADYAYSGQELSSGAMKALEQQWILAGMPYDDMQVWIDSQVVPAFLYGDGGQ